MTKNRKRWPRRRLRKPRRLRGVAVLPSLFTLGNAICGFAAIYYAAMPESDFHKRLFISPLALAGYFVSPLALAGYLVLIAILADAIDGRLARLSKSASNFGAQLDSLADVVSFGVAPAFLLLKLVGGTQGASTAVAPIVDKGIWLIAAIYLCCTVLRLARFNVESTVDISSHQGFKGLPSPAAAGTIASLVVLQQEFLGGATGLGNWLRDSIGVDFAAQVMVRALPAVTLVLALAMVSRIPYVHLLNQYVAGRRSFKHLVRLTIFFILCLVHLQIAMVCMFCGFGLSGPINLLRDRWRIARAKNELPSPAADSVSPDEPLSG
ncbi:MAG: CDP-alcohol phosphatidyltransferase family protein [Phycisphaerae bacterium]|nr:CDP-alcohol phosphatidyltransferase family protein [Phycisphaerae bacterium]